MSLSTALIAGLSACRAAPSPVDAPVTPPARIDVSPATPESPPTGWRYHPREAAGILAGQPLADGRWLLVGELGERWLIEGGGGGRSAQSAPHRAGEPLEHVLRWPGEERARWLFVGESGRTYFAQDPLGPLTAGPKAPSSIATITPIETGAFALDLFGRAHRLDGDSWEPVATEPRLFAAASASGDVVLGMSLPERHWRSPDGGATWTPLDLGPFGARRLLSREGGVVIDGASGAWLVSPDGTPRALGEPPPSVEDIPFEPRRGPSASALADGSAALVEGDYLEVLEPTGDDPRWRAVRGELGERLTIDRLPFDEICQSLSLAARGEHLWLGCRKSGGDAMRLELFHASDRGAQLRPVAVVTSQLPERVTIAVDARGLAMVSAVCPLDVPDCAPGAPLRVRPDGRLEPTAAPALVGPSFEPAFGAGGRAYFLGERSKDGQVALFVSEDGERFEAQPLETPRDQRGQVDRSLTVPRSLHPARHGEIGIAVHKTPPQYAVADARGRLTAVANLPENSVAVSGHGRRILAITRAEDATAPTAFQVWESNDAGVSFREVVLPMVLEPDELGDPPRLACGERGCVIGTRLTRLGWNTEAAPLLPLQRPDLASLDPRPATRTPFTCRAAGGAWTEHDAISAVDVLPHAGDIMRGDAAWSTLRHVTATGEVEAIAMMVTDDRPPRLVHQPLFGATGQRGDWALEVVHQLEGYAAVRVPVPTNRAALDGAPMHRLEAAWVNYLTATAARGTIADAGTFDAEDVTPGPRPSLVTGLVSISPHGLTLRPSAQRDDVWLIDVGGTVSAATRYPSFPATSFGASTEDATTAGGRAFGVTMLRADASSHASVVSLAPLGSDDARFVAIAPHAAGRIARTGWSYEGGQTGVVALFFDPRRGESLGYFSPFTTPGGLGPSEPIPTQGSLGDAAKACSAAERRAGVRVVAPFETGTRHPVLVEDGAEGVVMLTGSAILYGTAAAPCLAGWRAESIGSPSRSVAVITADLSRAWLLTERNGKLAHRPMRCERSPDAQLPTSIWSQAGTVEIPR